jgi:excisionase family DNA binding protein
MNTESNLMKPGEVAKLLRVDAKTVTRWAQAGRLRYTKTPGGHLRLYAVDIDAILNGEAQ